MKNNTQKYINKIGQNTGTSTIPKKVRKNEMTTLRVQLTQKLNSGSRLVKGRYSSSEEVGKPAPPASSSAFSGSNFGERKPIN